MLSLSMQFLLSVSLQLYLKYKVLPNVSHILEIMFRPNVCLRGERHAIFLPVPKIKRISGHLKIISKNVTNIWKHVNLVIFSNFSRNIYAYLRKDAYTNFIDKNIPPLMFVVNAGFDSQIRI